jgi:hypothetical protein
VKEIYVELDDHVAIATTLQVHVGGGRKRLCSAFSMCMCSCACVLVRVFLSVLSSYQRRDLQAGAEVALRSGNIPEALRQAHECENEYSRLDDRQGLSAAFRLLGNIQFVDGQVLASVGSLQVRLTEDSGCTVVRLTRTHRRRLTCSMTSHTTGVTPNISR